MFEMDNQAGGVLAFCQRRCVCMCLIYSRAQSLGGAVSPAPVCVCVCEQVNWNMKHNVNQD